ncbi:MAG: undecaprenyl-diphosphatase [Romboutsia sp.]
MTNLSISLLESMHSVGGSFPFINKLMVFFANYMIFILAGVMIYLWFFAKNKKRTRIMLLCCLLSFLLSELIGKVVGIFYYHNQPFVSLHSINHLINHQIDNSFPSDHTLLMFSICSMIYLFNRNKIGVFAIIIATLVSVSRMWVGVHWPIDVLVVALIGCFVSYIIYKVSFKIKVVKQQL